MTISIITITATPKDAPLDSHFKVGIARSKYLACKVCRSKSMSRSRNKGRQRIRTRRRSRRMYIYRSRMKETRKVLDIITCFNTLTGMRRVALKRIEQSRT